MSEGPADPARGAQNEDALVVTLNLARSTSSFADVVDGEYGSEGCTGCNGKVSRGGEFHSGFREGREKGDVGCGCESGGVFSSSNVQFCFPNRETVRSCT